MRFRLEGESLASIHEQAVAAHGPHARIVSAERVTVGGLGRFLAKEHYEAIIEVPDEHAPHGQVLEAGAGTEPARASGPAAEPARPGISTPKPTIPASGTYAPKALTPDSPIVSGGIDGLLERADAAELRLAPPGAGGARPVALPKLPGRPDFDRLLDSQAFALEPATGSRVAGPPAAGPGTPDGAAVRPGAPGREIVPSPLAGPGDLVVVIGLWGDAGMAAGELDDGTALRRTAGELAQKFEAQSLARNTLTDRRGVLKARADAVAQGVPLMVAVAINPLLALPGQLQLLDVLAPDQLWVAVDAGRKAEDTAAWVGAVAAGRGIYAAVSLHADETLSPESVWELGFPVLEAKEPGA